MYIDHFLTDDFVYWALPTRDYNGNDTFTAPIEFRGQLKNVVKEYILEDGNSTTSTAQILTGVKEVKEGGFIFVGKITDLTEEQILDPKSNKACFSIRTVNSVKMLDTKEEVRVLWL